METRQGRYVTCLLIRGSERGFSERGTRMRLRDRVITSLPAVVELPSGAVSLTS